MLNLARYHSIVNSHKAWWLKPAMLIVTLNILVGTTSCGLPFMQSGTPVPTPQCVEPSLMIGTLKYRVESTTRETNGFPDIPKRKKDIAYWVEGTTINYVFGLSPTKDNLALDSVLKAGDAMTINWADCSTDEYVLKSVKAAQTSDLTLFDQSAGGITVFVLTDSSGLIIRGERPIIQSAETPVPTSANATQLDIQFSDLTPPDDQSVKIGLNITNQGTQTVTLTNNNISLTTGNDSQIFPSLVEPALPQEIQPGGSITLAVTFPKSQANSAVLRIFDITFDYYFQ